MEVEDDIRTPRRCSLLRLEPRRSLHGRGSGKAVQGERGGLTFAAAAEMKGRYAVAPCADTAHTPARVKELAAMKRLIVLALLTLLCLMLRSSSRM